MRSSIPVGLSVLALALTVPATAALTFSGKETPGRARPDLNAFVNRRIDTTASLVKQVKADPEVADRYERHFAMNRRELVAYLGRLHPTRLAKTGAYTVYSVPDGGFVKMHRQALKKGSPVFADAAGRPTLIVKCGNPLTLGPSRSRKGNLLTVLPPEEEGTRQMAMVAPRDSDFETPEDLMAMIPALPEEILAPTSPLIGGAAAMPLVASVPASASGGSFPWLAGLPLLFPIVGSASHSGGNGDGGGLIAPVPEPATMAVMAVGCVVGARRRRRA